MASAPSLTACFSAVSANLLETIADLGEKLPNLSLGERAKWLKEAPPRINWTPLGGQTKPPRQGGADGVSNPRQLWKRDLRVEIEIWHEDIETTEALANHLIAAMQAVLTVGGHSVLAEAWNTSGELTKGVILTLTAEIKLPWVDEVSETTTVGTAPVTGAFSTG